MIFTSFDPVTRGTGEVARFDSPVRDASWDLTSDGSRLAVLPNERTRAVITVIPLAGATGLRAAVHAAVGQSWADRNQPEKARAAFESAIRECPASEAARTAERELHALGRVAVGPPAFALKTLSGAPVSLADFRGKVVYLKVWASW